MNKLKVEYDIPKQADIDTFFEVGKAIEKALKPFGYKRGASGFNFKTRIRDLAFDKKGE